MIKLIKERLISKNPWIEHYYDDVEFPNGVKGKYNRIVESNGIPGTVIIPRNQLGEIGLVHIFRYPVYQWIWELPKGFGESDISNIDNAHKELLEETGYVADNMISLNSFYANSGLMATRINVYLALKLHLEKKFKSTDEEAIDRFRFFKYSEILNCIKEGAFLDGISLSALALLHCYDLYANN